MSFWRKKKVVEPKAPHEDETSLGNILLRLRKVSPEQLAQALNAQACRRDHLLGHMLVEMGVVTEQEVTQALAVQNKMRAGERVEAELCVLESVMAESEECSRQLDRVIARHISASRPFLQLVEAKAS